MMTGRGRGRIRPPRRGLYGSSDTVDFEEAWGVLRASLLEIHGKNASQLSFEELYRHAYKLVLKKQGELLYQRVKDFEEVWLSETVRPLIYSAVSSVILPTDADATSITSSSSIERRVEGEKLLRTLKDAWEDHNLCVNMISDVLMYMERVYCKDFRKPSIVVTAMGQFRDTVLRSTCDAIGESRKPIAPALNTVILEQIRMDRDGEIIDRALVKSCVYMLEGLYETDDADESSKLYLTSFEPEFLSVSRAFYREEGAMLLLNNDAGTFCRHAKRRAVEEQDRCRSTLSLLTSPKIKAVIEEDLIGTHLKEIIALENSGVHFMLDNHRLADLEMIYDLSSRVDDEKRELKLAIQARVIHHGMNMNKVATDATANRPNDHPDTKNVHGVEPKSEDDKKGPEKLTNQQTTTAINWVNDILHLKAQYDHFLMEAFQSDQTIQTAITRSFSDFINYFERSSEFLSLFFDENMKKGIKGKSEQEVDDLIDQGITLLRFIQDKDLFERYYKRHLSKRLLMKRSVSMDAERQMISRMKLAVGNAFTARIEKMFQDMNTSADLTSSYKSYVAALGDPDPGRAELDVSVLTSTMWPVEMIMSKPREEEHHSSCIFPPEIENLKKGFEKFYLGKHSGRKLTWQASLGTAELRAHFPDCKGSRKGRELTVQTYGMLILLLFNDIPLGDSISCEEIQARTNIPLNELTRHLQSLSVAPKTRILRKEPMSKDVRTGDRFFFNSSYYSQFQKVKVLLVSSGNQVEGASERSATQKKNDEERQGVIDAALVRIMKQRKQSTHQKLITEVIQQLATRFSPELSMVKKRIESLIDREYLERLEQEPPAYRYLA